MDKELQDYIEEIIKGDVGLVSNDSGHIYSCQSMVQFINDECRAKSIIDEQTLANFKLNFNSKFIDKSRAFYLSEMDFKNLPTPLLNEGNTAFIPSKETNGVNVYQDVFVKDGEFYFCSNDEFMIIKHAK